MQINIITVGNLKEEYWRKAESEYIKRLSKFCDVNIIELKEQNITDNNLIQQSIEKEADEIQKKLKGFVIAMDIQGKSCSSEELSEKIDNIMLNGYSTITFIIGSSFGLSDKIKQMANLRLSFSKLTFPHQLFRIMLLEQIYRAFTIKNNIKYHK